MPSLKETRSLLRSLQRVYPAVEPLDQRIESAYIEIKDILSEIDDRQESVAVDPARLQQVEERLDLLYGLQQKHHLSSHEELMALQDDLQKRLDAIEHADEEVAALQEELTGQERVLRCAGRTAGRRRHAAACALPRNM